jgi:hypothetical protein
VEFATASTHRSADLLDCYGDPRDDLGERVSMEGV